MEKFLIIRKRQQLNRAEHALQELIGAASVDFNLDHEFRVRVSNALYEVEKCQVRLEELQAIAEGRANSLVIKQQEVK